MTTQETSHYMIYGREKGKRGGALMGISRETNKPVFGGANLIEALVFWDMGKEIMDMKITNLRNTYPDCEFEYKKVD